MSPSVTHAIPLSIIAPLKELQDALVVGPNPEPTPAQAEEVEASASPNKEKRLRGEKATILVSEEETKEEALTPKARKPTPEKRK